MNFKELMEARRAINFFDPDRDVSDSLIREMVTLASRAPSGFNLQPWSLMIIRDRDKKERLKGHAWKQEKITDAPVTMIVLADMDGWKFENPFAEKNFVQLVKAGEMKEAQRDWFANAASSLYGVSDQRKVAFACKNTGFFAMSLMLAGKSLGLETHPMDGFDIDGVRKEFKIPDNYWIMMLLAVGYLKPGITLRPPKWRKSFEEIVVDFK
jgi:nitroreductase